MSSQNWRTEVDASDYFGHQKKRVELEQRRPVVSRASDLVGPGIGESAIRITDFNELLATFNGYYSSAPGAYNAPTDSEAFIGTTVSDPVLGGRQTFTGLTSGYEYARTFVRSPTDPTSLSWGIWRGDERIPASATLSAAVDTDRISNQGVILLRAPSLETLGAPGSYGSGRNDVYVIRPGVYTGHLTIVGPLGLTLTNVEVRWPDRVGSKVSLLGPMSNAGRTIRVPFTFWSTGENQEIRVGVSHDNVVDQTLTWSDFAIARLGDIV